MRVVVVVFLCIALDLPLLVIEVGGDLHVMYRVDICPFPPPLSSIPFAILP